MLEGLAKLVECGCPVIFLEHLPEAAVTGEPIPAVLKTCPAVHLLDLQDTVCGKGFETVQLQPRSNRVRAMHSVGENEVVLLVNEGGETYDGFVTLPWTDSTVIYNAMENRAERAVTENSAVRVYMRPSESCVLVRGTAENAAESLWLFEAEHTFTLDAFEVSTCRSIDYPKFEDRGEITLPTSFDTVDPDFSGFIAYETGFTLDSVTRAVLEISDAHEAVEVFVNGESAGIELLPPFAYDITALLKPGENTLRIEAATTLEHENLKKETNMWDVNPKAPDPTGITGTVTLKYLNKRTARNRPKV